MGIWIGFTFWDIINNVAMNIVYKFLCEHKFLVLLDIYTGLELLGHIV
jgi:hypothetical protein